MDRTDVDSGCWNCDRNNSRRNRWRRFLDCKFFDVSCLRRWQITGTSPVFSTPFLRRIALSPQDASFLPFAVVFVRPPFVAESAGRVERSSAL